MAKPAPSIGAIETTPSGIKIAFYDKAHRYKIGMSGERGDLLRTVDDPDAVMRFVPSASGILDALPKSLTGWGERLGVAGVLEVLASHPDQRASEWTVEEMLKELQRHDLRWWQVREAAALNGTDVHTVFEQLTLGKPPRLGNYPLKKRGYIQAMCAFWAERKPTVLHSELMVASWEHQFAGRMDLLAVLDDDESNGEPEVIDLKTSKAVRESHHFQTGGYAIGVHESGYHHRRPGGRVLRVGADGKYELVKSWVDPEWFLAIKGSYDAIKAFEKATPAEHKRTRRAA